MPNFDEPNMGILRDVKGHFLTLLLAAVACCAPTAYGQIDWTPYENNPVIDAAFDNESLAIYRPTVVWWNGQYHLWYGKLWQQTRWMAYATSSDGIEWTWADNAVLGPSSIDGRFDEFEATHGWVILDSDTLKMWYSGGGSKASGIGLAWSLDGFVWTRVPGAEAGGSLLDPISDGVGALAITHPTVVKHDGTYYMWYVRAMTSTSSTIALARSANGRSWQVVQGNGQNGAVIDRGQGSAFDAIALLYPTALHNGERFEMWYQGLGPDPFVTVVPRVGCARSDNGVTWQKIAGSQADSGACFNSFAQPSVSEENGLYKMWYGLSATGQNGDVVMYATSGRAGTPNESPELPAPGRHLTIYPNPTPGPANLAFTVDHPDVYHIEVRDILGRLVSKTDLGLRPAGEHSARWDGRDSYGREAPGGAYLVRVGGGSAQPVSGILHILR